MSEMTGMNVRGFDQDGKLITETFPEMKTRVLKEQSEDANKAYNLTDELKVAVFDMIWNKPKKVGLRGFYAKERKTTESIVQDVE